MKKLAIIHRAGNSDWKSCQNITANLKSSYKSALTDHEIKEFNSLSEFNDFDGFELAQKIFQWGATKIIWIDHKPHASALIKGLNHVYQNINFNSRPPLFIHLFGDFILDCLGWQRIEEQLTLYPVHLFVASLAQKTLVDTLIKNDNNLTSIIPFPVATQFFKFENQDYVNFCKDKWGGFNKKVFLYSGRITYQKNILELILVFQNIIKADSNVELWIAGNWDNIYLPYAGKVGVPGSFYSQVKKVLDLSPTNNIRFLGALNEKDLKEVYHAADTFISPSTYNDEDYGMSPAEALACGMPCMLSTWGGYNSFAAMFPWINKLPIRFEAERPIIDISLSQKKILLTALAHETNFNQKENQSNQVAGKISIESIAKLLREKMEHFTPKPFTEFSETFDELCAQFRIMPEAPFKDRHGNLSLFYKRLYECYSNEHN